jgi:hypothetical protein
MLVEKSGWLNKPKAELLAAWLNEHGALEVTGDKVAIETAITENRLSGLSIDLVLNGLDDVDARRETQRLWPSVIVDGGINEVGAAVVQHRLDQPQSACLLCWFEAPKADEKTAQSRWTGLHRDSLHDADRQLSDKDISAAAESKRDWLQKCRREGKTVCSIITEAQLAARLGIAANDGFRPSVPFVASASASLIVSAAVKGSTFPEYPMPSKFQIGSLFLGPAHSACVERLPFARCQCVLQRKTIDRVRGARARRTGSK